MHRTLGRGESIGQSLLRYFGNAREESPGSVGRSAR